MDAISDSKPCAPEAVHDNTLILELRPGDLARAAQTSHNDSGSALHIVVEHALLRAVGSEQPRRVGFAEILKVEEGFRVVLPHHSAELFEQRIVLLPSKTLFPNAEVERVVE